MNQYEPLDFRILNQFGQSHFNAGVFNIRKARTGRTPSYFSGGSMANIRSAQAIVSFKLRFTKIAGEFHMSLGQCAILVASTHYLYISYNIIYTYKIYTKNIIQLGYFTI